MNWREIQEVLDETQALNWRLHQVVQPDFERLYLELHQGETVHWLVFVLKSPFARFHLARPPLRKKGPKPRFAEFLQAHISGARLDRMEQFSHDRIVVLYLHLDGQDFRLVVRLWNNAANILLLDAQDQILDCFFRRPARQETTGETFRFPAPSLAPSGKDQGIPELPDFPKANPYPFSSFLESTFLFKESQEERTRLQTRITKTAQELSIALEGKIRRLETRISKAQTFNEWKTLGDMVLAEAWRIPKGSRFADLDDWRNPGCQVRIELDPKLDAVQNAHALYQRFQKDRDGLSYHEDELKQRRRELAQVQGLEARYAPDLEMYELRKLAAELDQLHQTSKSQGTQDENLVPGARFVLHGYPILVGRNAKESDELLRHHVRGNDLWLHVRDYPGGYVFIKVPRGKQVPPDVLVDAAHLAAWYSKGKEERELDLYYTHVKYLRRPKEAKYGTVLPTQEKNLHLRVEPDRLKAILEP